VFNNGVGSQQTIDLSASENTCWEAGVLTGGKYTAIEVTCPTVIGIGEENTRGINCYPNPTKGLLVVQTDLQSTKLNLYNASGKRIDFLSQKTQNGWELDLRNHPKGLYLLRIEACSGDVEFVKIVKE
jgi:hypothetical protein